MQSTSFLLTRNNTYEVLFSNNDKKSYHDIKYTDYTTIVSNVNNDVQLDFEIIAPNIPNLDKVVLSTNISHDFSDEKKKQFDIMANKIEYHEIKSQTESSKNILIKRPSLKALDSGARYYVQQQFDNVIIGTNLSPKVTTVESFDNNTASVGISNTFRNDPITITLTGVLHFQIFNNKLQITKITLRPSDVSYKIEKD